MNSFFRWFWANFYKLGLAFEKRNIDKEYDKLSICDQMSVHQIEELQFQRLKEILLFVDKNVPYYQKIFREYNFNPQEFYDIKELEKLPYMDKEIVKANTEMLLAPAFRANKIERMTGGSTGEKLKIYYGPQSLDVTAAIVMRCQSWAGKKIGDRAVHFSSNIFKDISWRDALREWMKCTVLHRKNILLDVFDDRTFDRVLDLLSDYHPYIVQGFPSIAYAIARYAEKKKYNIKGLFQIYESTGETLYDFQREKIEEVFGCELFNRYGDAEFGIIAYECNLHKGLHVQSDVVYVETPVIEDGGKPEIVVTSLTNYVMPLIRYRTGDLAQLSKVPCECGLPYPRLEQMQGRIHDFISLDGGVELSTTYLLDLFDRFGGVNDFQVCVLEGCLNVYILLDGVMSLETLKEIQKSLSEDTRYQLKISIHIVKKLQVTSAGKFRYIIGENTHYELDNQVEIYKDKNGTIDVENGETCFPVVSWTTK